MKKLLSVIVPVYNAEPYVSRCIESILSQSYKTFELLIIDDGSMDESYQICARYADLDSRITLIHQEHSGVAYARKTAISMASGEYIAFVDSDDWVEGDYLETAAAHLDAVDVVMMGYYADDTGYHPPLAAEGIYWGKGLETVWRSMFNVSGVLWNKVLKTSLVKAAAVNIPNALYVSEDRCIGTQVLLSAQKIYVLDIGRYHYCINKNSITHRVHKDFLYNEHLYYQTMSKIIKQHPFEAELSKALDKNMADRLPSIINMLGIATDNFWYYPYYGRLVSARVILYGAGKVGQSYYHSIIRSKESVIVAWVDWEYMAYREKGFDVISPDSIDRLEYDYVIIGVYDEAKAIDIKKSLLHLGVLEETILWNKTRKTIGY